VEPTFTDDGAGGQLPGTPIVVETVMAQLDPNSGREILTSGGVAATLPVRFRIAYREDVDATWAVEWRGQRFQLAGPPQPDGYAFRQWLVLTAESGGPE
jgi:SPP1 family predicted phage head-tail adaptor